MPKRKPAKPTSEMTTDELAASVFPKRVITKVKKILAEREQPKKRKP